MDTKKEESKSKNENVLENGSYSIYGPENGDITFDTIELHAGSGAKRIWKVEEFSREKIVLKVIKFG